MLCGGGALSNASPVIKIIHGIPAAIRGVVKMISPCVLLWGVCAIERISVDGQHVRDPRSYGVW